MSDEAKDRGRLQSVLVEASITHSFHTVDGGRITCVNADEAEAQRQQWGTAPPISPFVSLHLSLYFTLMSKDVPIEGQTVPAKN